MTVTSADAVRLADEAIAASNGMVGLGAGLLQTSLMQVAATYSVAAAIFDLAAAVREKGIAP
jgi:hypothetical protein